MSVEGTGQMQKPLSQTLTKSQRRIILLAVAIGTFMGPLDGSVVNIALPSISAYYGVPLSSVEWVLMSYLLTISSLLLTFGRLGDLYGYKRIYMTGFIIFTAGSVCCGLAPSIAMLVSSRAVQAVGAGMMLSMGPAIVTNITPPQERGKSLGLIAISVSVALSAGPVLGGLLTNEFGWQSIFFINIPVGIIACLLAWKVIPNMKNREVQPFDVMGSVLFFLALICILLPLSYTERLGWSNPIILGSLGSGIFLLLLFIIYEEKTEHPMLDVSLFNNRLFSMGNLSALLSYMSLYAVILLMPFYLQQLLGKSPSQAGLLLIAMPLVTMVVAPVSGSLSDRFDTRYVSSLGMGIMALGLWLLSTLDARSGTAAIMAYLAVIGLGQGMFQTPNNSAVLGTVQPQRRGIASGMLAVMRNTGMVLGVAVTGAAFSISRHYWEKVLQSQGRTGPALVQGAFEGAMHFAFLLAALLAVTAVGTSLIRGPLNNRH